MQQTAVLNIVGLSPGLIGDDTPFLKQWFASGQLAHVDSMLPAVTCSVQATYLTGQWPDSHGIVANGWYFRELDEVKFWRQSNRLIQSPKIWEKAKSVDPDFTCANLFWWYNMNSSADYLVTPRPIYRADGVKIPDILTHPAGLRDDLQDRLGQFPLFNFWGPNTTIDSSRWIVEASKQVVETYDPTLTLVYIPHLDYNLQRVGPSDPAIPRDLRELDDLCKDLVTFFETRGTDVIILSEYGITAVDKPVSLNRTLREKGYITVREEKGGEILIPGSSRAFAVSDHQIAHVYVNNPDDIAAVKACLGQLSGVESVHDRSEMSRFHLDHERSGDLLVIAEHDAWFTYYYWLDDEKAPDFAPTVDIHNKPGYDPAELLVNPDIRFPKVRAASRLLQKKLGFRYKMDLIPLHGDGVRGSHGRIVESPLDGPLIATQRKELLSGKAVKPTDVHDIIYSHLSRS